MGDTFTNGSLVNHDDEVYLDKIMTHRWPNGQKKCEVCRVMRTHVRIPGRTAYACQRCRHQIYPLAGTIFEGSKTPLSLWFKACHLYLSNFLVTATSIRRELDVTYKTAWRMLNAIHHLGKTEWIQEDDRPLAEVESRIVATVVADAIAKGPKAVPSPSRRTHNEMCDPNGDSKRVDTTGKKAKRPEIDPAEVVRYAKLGFTVSVIARLLNCKRHVLLSYYASEIAEGRAAGNVSGRRERRKYAITYRRQTLTSDDSSPKTLQGIIGAARPLL